MTVQESAQRFTLVPIDQCRLIDNVRRDVGDIDSLTASIRTHGVLEPIIGCPTEDGSAVDVIVGQRRLAAARAAGLTLIPCMLRARPAEQPRLLMQLAENFERGDMSALDEALAFRDLTKTGLTQAHLAKVVGRSQGYVSRRLRILTLPESLQLAIDLEWVHDFVALGVPTELYRTAAARKRLGAAVKGGDQGVRRWVQEELARKDPSAQKPRTREFGTINLRRDILDRARIAAHDARQPLTDWVENLILKGLA